MASEASEMSSMSSMSELSPAPGTGADDQKSAKQKWILIAAIIFLFGCTLLVSTLTLGLLSSDGGQQGSGEKPTDEGAPDFVYPPSAPPPSGTPATSTGDTSTTKPSETTTTSTTQKPNPLVCVSTDASDDKLIPPKKLCDYLIFDAVYDDLPAFNLPLSAGLKDFASRTKVEAYIRYGVAFGKTAREDALKNLRTGEDMKWTKSIWEKGIRTYAIFDFELSMKTTDSQVDEIITLSKRLLEMGKALTSQDSSERAFLILGVVALYEDSAVKQMADYYNKLLEQIHPDVVVFVTTYLREFLTPDPVCRIVGPSVWNDATIPDQPTFVGTLRFLRELTLPKGLPKTLSLSITGRYAFFESSVARTSWSGIGVKEQCTKMARVAYQFMQCPGGDRYGSFHAYADANYKDEHRQTKYGRTNTWKWILSFDTNRTIAQKICWSQHANPPFDGGWTVFDVQASDVGHTCPDNVYKDGFRLLHWIKHYMGNPPPDCENIGSQFEEW